MDDLFVGRIKIENPSSKGPGGMKDSLTGLDRYEVFLKKLQKAIDNMGDRRIVIVYTLRQFKFDQIRRHMILVKQLLHII